MASPPSRARPTDRRPQGACHASSLRLLDHSAGRRAHGVPRQGARGVAADAGATAAPPARRRHEVGGAGAGVGIARPRQARPRSGARRVTGAWRGVAARRRTPRPARALQAATRREAPRHGPEVRVEETRRGWSGCGPITGRTPRAPRARRRLRPRQRPPRAQALGDCKPEGDRKPWGEGRPPGPRKPWSDRPPRDDRGPGGDRGPASDRPARKPWGLQARGRPQALGRRPATRAPQALE